MRKGGKRLQMRSASPRKKGGKRLQTRRSEPLEKRGGKRLQIQQQKTHGKPRGVMAAAILLAVSTAVIAGVTFGWYDLLRETQAAEVVLASAGENVNVDGFTLFTYEDEESGLFLDEATIKLKSYDSVFGKNSETPVYILIPVSGEAVQNGNTLMFVFDCGNGNETLMDETDASNPKIKPLFSNVAQLRYVVVSEPSGLTSYTDARDQFYMEDGSVKSGVSASKCFAYFTVDSNTHAPIPVRPKTSAVSLSVPGDSDADVLYVLFELDYNFDLMTGFVKNHTSDTSGRLDLSQKIPFEPDTFNITVSAS